MKKILTIIMLAGIVLSAKAQDETIYNPKTLFGGDKSVRGFIGLNTKGIQLNNQVAVLTGAEVDLVLGHRLNIGFFGYGKINEVQSNFFDIQGYRNYYELGMGGFKLEPVLFTNALIHLTIPVQMGAGVMSLNRQRLIDYNYYNDDYYNWENTIYDFDTFVFVEPSVSAELNLLKHMRLNVGVGYLVTDKINLAGTNAYPMEGFTGNISLRLGWF